MAGSAAASSPPYCGRFAPSPTGPMHFGSLLAALASYLDARSHGGRWLVRMEDLDRPRERPGAADDILTALEQHGLHWDGPVIRQSTRDAAYAAALARLAEQDLLFYCTCTRSQLRGLPVYPGTCRQRRKAPATSHAIRIRVPDQHVSFEDRLQGPQSEQLARDCGDFIVRRRDGLFAYQLAVVVDDAWQQVTHVVRGADLMDSTARQRFLADSLHLAPVSFAHIPVIAGPDGRKLSKRWQAQPLQPGTASASLFSALSALGQAPPADAWGAPVNELLDWAHHHWRWSAVPRERQSSLICGLG